MANSYKREYLDPRTNKKGRARIAARIVSNVRALNPPGRFLKEDSHTKNWLEIGDERACAKSGQALRENAPEIRAELLGLAGQQNNGTRDFAAPREISLEGLDTTSPTQINLALNESIQSAQKMEAEIKSLKHKISGFGMSTNRSIQDVENEIDLVQQRIDSNKRKRPLDMFILSGQCTNPSVQWLSYCNGDGGIGKEHDDWAIFNMSLSGLENELTRHGLVFQSGLPFTSLLPLVMLRRYPLTKELNGVMRWEELPVGDIGIAACPQSQNGGTWVIQSVDSKCAMKDKINTGDVVVSINNVPIPRPIANTWAGMLFNNGASPSSVSKGDSVKFSCWVGLITPHSNKKVAAAGLPVAVEPTTSELFDVVDNLFLEADNDTVTVKDIVRSVANHFNISKVDKEMKKMIKARLTDLIQGDVVVEEDHKSPQKSASVDINTNKVAAAANTGQKNRIVTPDQTNNTNAMVDHTMNMSGEVMDQLASNVLSTNTNEDKDNGEEHKKQSSKLPLSAGTNTTSLMSEEEGDLLANYFLNGSSPTTKPQQSRVQDTTDFDSMKASLLGNTNLDSATATESQDYDDRGGNEYLFDDEDTPSPKPSGEESPPEPFPLTSAIPSASEKVGEDMAAVESEKSAVEEDKRVRREKMIAEQLTAEAEEENKAKEEDERIRLEKLEDDRKAKAEERISDADEQAKEKDHLDLDSLVTFINNSSVERLERVLIGGCYGCWAVLVAMIISFAIIMCKAMDIYLKN